MVRDTSRFVRIFTFSLTSEEVKVVLRDSSTVLSDLKKIQKSLGLIQCLYFSDGICSIKSFVLVFLSVDTSADTKHYILQSLVAREPDVTLQEMHLILSKPH